ncbi:unnamed protein product [Pneumocystis jirovecii]|uniref:Uncharacterized protein n=2 Tax=Pneumocystis jirovecii TaxID=42068 RepID=L0PCX9_PNEJI|nr:unnamed protein product [Pneumocystis jirovecii]
MRTQSQSFNTRKALKNESNERLTPSKKKDNANSRSLGVELPAGSVPHFDAKNDKMTPRKLSSTSCKQLDHYAGPTFHHSPAASNLPIPTFLSKVNDTPQHLSISHSEQPKLYNKQPAPRALSSSPMHKLFESPDSPIMSEIHSDILQHKKVAQNTSFYGDFTHLAHESHFSSPELVSQADIKEKKQRHIPLKHETTILSEIEVDKKKKTKQSVTLLTHSSDLVDTQQKLRNNDQKYFSKKKKNWSKYDLYIDDNISEKEDLKNKLLSLLLPSSSISNKSSTTNFPKSKT